MIKNKSGQSNVFGMSFSTIVSIILIVFFIYAAFMAIGAFLNYQKSATIGMFLEDLQNKIDEAWYAEGATYNFTSTVPGGVEYVCFVNITAPIKNANDQEKAIYQTMHEGAISNFKNNFYIYAPKNDYGIKWTTIKHVDLSQKNPICAKVISGKVRLGITRDYSNPLVRVSA
jgi:hypothetical protein